LKTNRFDVFGAVADVEVGSDVIEVPFADPVDGPEPPIAGVLAAL
jgi:hypothetical protein